jgi:hypothetical protein
MNKRLKELSEQAGLYLDLDGVPYPRALSAEKCNEVYEKFAELIIKECVENFAKVWYEQGLDIRGAELNKFMKRFDEHFGLK